MRVVSAGTSFELGATETTPTIGIVDYSRRTTDDFGVTTVVERGFARRMSLRMAVPFDGVDALQQRLADLRASTALWVADETIAWLSVEGFYKDFEIDLAVPPTSFCTLTVEGLAEAETVIDAGGDPAPDDQSSTLLLLQPTAVTDAILTGSSVDENDYPEWSPAVTYAAGVRTKRTARHRVYESAVAGNIGHDPLADTGQWIDLRPTNRWAMFDQALGTATSAAALIVVTLGVAGATAVALLDVTGSTVRVQATGYDQTQPVTVGAILFDGLPGGMDAITITVTGAGTVAVGTLLVGKIVSLGLTEASPSAGITDFSRKVVDDFGAVTVVQRAWAKRMTAHALIRTDAVDQVANRIAAVRARPSLWLGSARTDSLTAYGFFKEFSIEVGDVVSKLSLSIEGLSKAVALTDPLGDLAQQLAQAEADAAAARALIERKSTTFNQDDPPSADESVENDLWLDTNGGNFAYRRLPGTGQLAFGGGLLTFGGVALVLAPWEPAADERIDVALHRVPPITDVHVNASYAGATSAGQLPQYRSAQHLVGTADHSDTAFVVASATGGVEVTVNNTTGDAQRGLITITNSASNQHLPAITVVSGTSTLDGVDVHFAFQILRDDGSVPAAPPPATGSGPSGPATANVTVSPGTSSDVEMARTSAVTVGSGGSVAITCPVTYYDHNEGPKMSSDDAVGAVLDARLEYSTDTGAMWTAAPGSAASITGSPAYAYFSSSVPKGPRDEPAAVFLSATIAGLAAGTAVTVRVVGSADIGNIATVEGLLTAVPT